jgi:SAM-dependent methyltransferase
MAAPGLESLESDLAAWLPRLIRLWRKQARSQWHDAPAGCLAPAEAKSVAAGIKRLSQGLTRERELAGEFYFSDPVMFGAYLLYFWPVSYTQARLALAALPGLPESVLDLGGGAGPLAAAAYDAGVRQIRLADRSRKALQWAAELFQGLDAGVECVAWDPVQQSEFPDAGRRYDVIALQHVLNELWAASPDKQAAKLSLLQRAIDALTETGNLMILEPALKSTSQAVLALRDALIPQGVVPVFPCLHQQPCPALRAQDSCHAESMWQPPEWVQDLIHRAGLHKQWLKMTLMIFRKADAMPADAEMYLTVSELKRAKNKNVFIVVCGNSGRMDIALAPRNADESKRFFMKLKPGQVIRVRNARATAQGLELVPASTVTLAEAAAPHLRILAG